MMTGANRESISTGGSCSHSSLRAGASRCRLEERDREVRFYVFRPSALGVLRWMLNDRMARTRAV